MKLYHFSEDPCIEVFEPRPPLAHPEVEPRVWAIDEWHSPTYFFPRDCPRVCVWPLPTTTKEDRKEWMSEGKRMVIAIEESWRAMLERARIYRYEMPPESFIDCNDHGVQVSRSAVRPLSVERLSDPARLLEEAGVELRFVPSLVEIAKAAMRTSLHFSLIRMGNAVGWDLAPGGPVVEPSGHFPASR